MPVHDTRTECGFRWALDDPSDEDVIAENTHVCVKLKDHLSDHRCGCGEYAGTPGG